MENDDEQFEQILKTIDSIFEEMDSVNPNFNLKYELEKFLKKNFYLDKDDSES